jgi:hypothetical protein
MEVPCTHCSCVPFLNTAPGYICSTSILEKSPQKRNLGGNINYAVFSSWKVYSIIIIDLELCLDVLFRHLFWTLMQLENSCCFLTPLVVFLAVILVVVVVYFALRNAFRRWVSIQHVASKQCSQLLPLVIINRLTTLQRRLRVLFYRLPLFNGFTYWSTKVAVYVL